MRIAISAIMAFCAVTLVATSFPASASPTHGYTYARVYVKGQVSQYTYTVDQSGEEITAVARLKSYVHGGIGGEQVKWFALYSDGQDLSAQARAFPPYEMSLDPKDPDGLTQPDTQTAGLLQYPVLDLYTFYEGLSDSVVGIDNLHQPGQSYVEPTLLHGNFPSATAPVGQDLTQPTTTLTSLSARQATFTESFQPPAGGGLTLSEPWMSSPVCGSIPNNFELVQAEGSQWAALWGCESFTDTIVVDRASGQIVSAQQTDTLQVDVTVCQDEALTECGPIQPTSLLRTVQLTRN
jgi:hypothetical protein